MRNYSFEAHIHTDAGLPFIFHYNVVTNSQDFTEHLNWHRNIEILCFTEGSGTVVCDFHTYPVSAGMIFVVNSNSVHTVKSDSKIEYFCLIPDEEFCADNDIPTDNIIYKNTICDVQAYNMFMDIVSEYNGDKSYRRAGIKSSVLNFLVYISRNHIDNTFSYGKKAGLKSLENMKIALGYMQSHFAERLIIDEIAAETGLSKYHFIREFKSVVGVTPITYLNTVRCENAKKMLLTKKYSINEILAENGFENASYFTKVFKKYSGMTPTEYLKTNEDK